jgi:TolB-like protein/Tfp pilus assembly protein PilF
MPSFVAELQRRNVLKIAAAYALVSWILIEAGSVLLPTFGAPEWFFRVYVLIVAAGFVVSLVVAWIYEVTPEGVKRDKDVDRSTSGTGQTGRRLNYGIIGLLAVALAVSITLNVSGMRQGDAPADDVTRQGSIAVLPFTSRSTDPENALFTDGIHDDLLTSLANVRALKVISRTSVLKYRDTTKNLREIGNELGVANVVEGSVQRAGNNVRINVQLIDARTDEHIWAKIYDRELTAKNIFRIQSEISRAITGALRKQLTPAEQDRLVTVPTENLEAYRLYIAGRNNVYERRLETLKLARQQFLEAIDLDPQYAQAYSGLADSVMLLLINHSAIPQEEAFAQAQAALDKSLELDDTNVDAWASLGLLEMHRAQQTSVDPDYAPAEAAFTRAIELSGNHAEAYSWYASLKNAKLEYDAAIELFRKSLELDPLARVPRSNLAHVYAQLGRNDDALEQWLAATRINPEWPVAYDNIARHLVGLGRFDEAYAWAEAARPLSTDPLTGQTRISVLLQFGENRRAAAMLDAIPERHPLKPTALAYQAFFAGNLAEAMERWEAIVSAGASPIQNVVIDAVSDAAAIMGDYETSLDYCLRLTPTLTEPRFKVDELNAHNALKYAFLLQRDEPGSARAAALLDDLLVQFESGPRMGASGHGIRDVQVLALQGKQSQALARLQRAFEEGFRGVRNFDNWSLAEDPYLVSIRDTPEFRDVTAGIAAANTLMKARLEDAIATDDLESLRDLTRRNDRQ